MAETCFGFTVEKVREYMRPSGALDGNSKSYDPILGAGGSGGNYTMPMITHPPPQKLTYKLKRAFLLSTVLLKSCYVSSKLISGG